MFNAANILEALKNYIHTHGGTSNAYNIAEAVNDLNSIPQGSGGGIPEAPIDDNQYARKNGDWSKVESSGEDIPPEVTNAVETHGMGWTSEEEVEGFDITWDGNTEGLESFMDTYFKISDKVYTEDELIGANGKLFSNNVINEGIVSLYIPESEGSMPDSVRMYNIVGDVPQHFYAHQVIMVVLEDTEVLTEGEVMILHKGTYSESNLGDLYVSHLYKEATTEEVVHQIDQKYIPQSSGGGMFATVVFDDNLVGTADKTLSELVTAYESGMNVIATIEAFDITIAKVTCTQYADGALRFGMPARIDDDGFCLVPLEVYDNDGVDVWETTML